MMQTANFCVDDNRLGIAHDHTGTGAAVSQSSSNTNVYNFLYVVADTT